MSTQPVALYYHQEARMTFRWERGDVEMVVYRGNEITHPGCPVVYRVPVPANGWLDQSEVRRRAHAWWTAERIPRN